MRIFTVVVRYKTPLDESRTMTTLAEAFRRRAELANTYQLLVWDNSPVSDQNIDFPVPYLYSHSARNVGVSGAYNAALQLALESDCPWMLLLDQDSTIGVDFLSGMIEYCEALLPRTEVAAIAPTVRMGKTVVSPVRRMFGRARSYHRNESGIAPGEASAINSGCVMRTSALQIIGGFSLDFWLDFSDVYVFHQFSLRGMKLWWAAGLDLEHDLSAMDYGNKMTPWRCRNFSLAESAFHDCYSGALENMVLTFRLLARAVKHWLKYRNSHFARIAWALFLFRVREPRAGRIRREFVALRSSSAEWEDGAKMRVFHD